MCNFDIDMEIFCRVWQKWNFVYKNLQCIGRGLECIGRREIDHLATKIELGLVDRNKNTSVLKTFLLIDSQSLRAHGCKMHSICLYFILVSWEEFLCISQGVWFSLNSQRYSDYTHCPTHLHSLFLLYLTHLLRTVKCFIHTWLKAVSAIYSFGSSADGISNCARIFCNLKAVEPHTAM